jgi:hypothetical protein
MAVCQLCKSRKGKRACPALRSGICPACCGEKRVVEIACPPDCAYLEKGAQNEVRREASGYLQRQDPKKAVRWVRTMEALGFLMEGIERIVAAAPRAVDDGDLAAALAAARTTFESEAKGVIYEQYPTSPTAEALTRELVGGIRSMRKAMDEHRARAGEGGRGLPEWGPAEAAHCLDVLAERCEYHLGRKAETGSLVEHLRRIYPAPGREPGGPEPSRIILT